MNNPAINSKDEHIKYSRVFSSFLCSTSIIALTILCILNNMVLDIYSALILFKIVVPTSLCFWFIGKIIGKIFDGQNEVIIEEKIVEEKKAYEIPSMFGADIEDNNDESGVI